MTNENTLTQVAGTALLMDDRHPRANTDHAADVMIAEVDVWRSLAINPALTFSNAEECDGFCIVFPAAEEAACILEAQVWWAA